MDQGSLDIPQIIYLSNVVAYFKTFPDYLKPSPVLYLTDNILDYKILPVTC